MFGNAREMKTTHFKKVEIAQLNEASKCRQEAFDIGQEIVEIQNRIQKRVDKKS